MASRAPPLVAAIGARKTGKTSWLLDTVRRARPVRLLIWDPIGEGADPRVRLSLLGTVFTDRAKLVDHVGTQGRFAAVFQPGDNSALDPKRHAGFKTRYELLFDWYCRLAWALGDLTLIIDELADVTSPHRAPARWKEITRKGANRGIAAFAASQRPAEVDSTFLGNCTFIHCGRVNDRSSVETMANVLDVGADELRALRDFEFIERNMQTGAVRRGRLSFAS